MLCNILVLGGPGNADRQSEVIRRSSLASSQPPADVTINPEMVVVTKANSPDEDRLATIAFMGE